MKKILAGIAIVGIGMWVASCVDEPKAPVSPESTGATAQTLAPANPQGMDKVTVHLQWPSQSAVGMSTQSSSAASGPVLAPQTLEATLKPGEALLEHKVLSLPAGVPPALDVLYCFDITGSMGGEITNAAAGCLTTIAAIRNVVPDSRFGVISHQDYPGSYSGCGYVSQYGDQTDVPYRRAQPLTSDQTAVLQAINGLQAGGGGDAPEDYSRAFFESYSDPGIGFRSGARKIVVALLDAIPHDCQYDAILEGTSTSGPDPGRDGIVPSGDDLTILGVLDGMSANGITLIPVYSGNGAYLNLWKAYAARTGGQAFQINQDGTGMDIASFVTTVIQSSANHINTVTLHTSDAAYNAWLTSVMPSSYTNVELGTANDLAFDIQIVPPAATPDGNYSFDICAVADGTDIATQHVSITVHRTVSVPFDFDPGACPNQFKMWTKGDVSSAICGTAAWDVKKIDPATVRLEGVPAVSWAYRDVCTPYVPLIGKMQCNECNTLGRDGKQDLTLKFDKQALIAKMGTLTHLEARVVHISGLLKPEYGGWPIVGEDVLLILYH